MLVHSRLRPAALEPRFLGAALDLVAALEEPARQPSWMGAGATSLAVTLAPGARDRLRRSAE